MFGKLGHVTYFDLFALSMTFETFILLLRFHLFTLFKKEVHIPIQNPKLSEDRSFGHEQESH